MQPDKSMFRRIRPDDLPPALHSAGSSPSTTPLPLPPASPPRGAIGKPPMPLPTGPDEQTECPCCGEVLDVVTIPNGRKGEPYYVWRLCEKLRMAWSARDAATARRDAETRQADAERALGDPGLARIAHLKLETYNPDLLRVRFGHENPHGLVCDWLEKIRASAEGDYHRGPPVALYLYFPGKGTGKTHLAAGAVNRARGWGRLSVFVEEASYISHAWSAPLKDREQLAALPGDLAWLTAIDDMGQLPPRASDDTNGIEKLWYDVINRRWLRRRWTIFTSNRTPEELYEQATINDATLSRLLQMTRGEVVLVEGDDQRRRRPQ